MTAPRDAFVGSLLGTAVGDAVGLPYEGLSRNRARKMYSGEVRPRLLFGRGMVSDDTEHACITAQALIAAGDDCGQFLRRLTTGMRLWLLGVPAGIGLATLRATLKLSVGIPPSRSGVFSAGNGPAMRAAILGVAIDDIEQLRPFTRACCRVTHTDPKAEQGALAVALAARLARDGSPVDPRTYLEMLGRVMQSSRDSELLHLIAQTVASVSAGQSTQDFADQSGLSKGVSGYMLHTVPISIHSWLSHPKDFRAAVTNIILCGGDTDSTAAIVGGIVGSAVGKCGIPQDWLARIWEWARVIDWIERLADQLHQVSIAGKPRSPLRLPIYGVLPRNALFASVVLTHGFRRLLPPYA